MEVAIHFPAFHPAPLVKKTKNVTKHQVRDTIIFGYSSVQKIHECNILLWNIWFPRLSSSSSRVCAVSRSVEERLFCQPSNFLKGWSFLHNRF